MLDRLHTWARRPFFAEGLNLAQSIMFHGFGAIAVMLFVPLALDAVGIW